MFVSHAQTDRQTDNFI